MHQLFHLLHLIFLIPIFWKYIQILKKKSYSTRDVTYFKANFTYIVTLKIWLADQCHYAFIDIGVLNDHAFLTVVY